MTKKIAIICLFLLSFLISWNIFRPGFFSMHDDMQVIRLYEMKRCLNDGQIPCRWSPDLSMGYGQPMFNYYSATPYYIGALFKSLGLSYLSSVKLLMFISISLAGLAMFLFLSEFINPLSAFVGGAAYMLVPYRALEIFVRGALAENFALALLPLVLFGIVRLLRNRDKTSFVLLSIFSGLFLATHNITTLLSSLLIISFSVLLILLGKNKIKCFYLLFLSAVLGLGLASFFIIPVVFEGSLVDTSFLTTDYFDYHAHFVTLKQLFVNQNWGYGSSEFGPSDNISFSVGILQSLSLLFAPLVLFKKQKSSGVNKKIIIGLFWILGVLSLFLTTARSAFIWDSVSVFRYIQFPWRLLGLVAVSTSVIIGIVTDSFTEKTQKILSIVSVIVLILFNFRYFKFEKYYQQSTDDAYLSGQNFVTQQGSAFYDYRPLSMTVLPDKPAPPMPSVLSGIVQMDSFQNRSNYFSVEVEVYSEEAVIAFPVSSFPNWTVYLNHSISSTPYKTGDKYGEIILTFKKGHTLVQGYFENTPVRTFSDIITAVSILSIMVIALTPNAKKTDQ